MRLPGGDLLTRDTHDGFWVEPWGVPSEVTPPDWWALPGLVDAHAHLARAEMDFGPGDLEGATQRARAALSSGVGLILDKGWRDLTMVNLIDKVPVSERPDVEAAGVILAVEGGFWEGFARNVATDGLGEAVEQAAEESRGWVKLVGDWPRKGSGPTVNFDEAELAEAVSIARAHHTRVAVHTMAREVPSMAVRAGIDSIEHGLFLSTEDLAVLGGRGGMWVPTVVQVEAVIQQLGERSSGGRLLLEGLQNIARILGAAVEAGVHVLTGTDLAIGTDQVAMEAIRLWELGMEPRAVIDSVSTSGYRATGRPSAFDVGDPANVVLFAENPVTNPRVLAHPALVIRMGRIVA